VPVEELEPNPAEQGDFSEIAGVPLYDSPPPFIPDMTFFEEVIAFRAVKRSAQFNNISRIIS
jgi:hypothetical protein